MFTEIWGDTINFFRDGFQNPSPYLTSSKKFTAEYAVRQTLDQITFDLAILQRARNQRCYALTVPAERSALIRADILAYRALIPAIKAGLIKNTAVVTYFQKAPSVRIIPYAKAALVGLPFSCLDYEKNARDFLSIAHEIGHHVFWHGIRLDRPIRSVVQTALPKDIPDWTKNWLEEIFADVYGAQVAGPLIAYDFQELMLDNPGFDKDDGEHPIPAMRPYIYIDTLSKITQSNGDKLFPSAPTVLQNNWESWRQERAELNLVQPDGEGEPIMIDSVRTQVAKVIDTVRTVANFPTPTGNYGSWGADITVINDTLYTTFYNDFLKDSDNLQDYVPEITKKNDQLTIDPVSFSETIGDKETWEAGTTDGIWFKFLRQAQTDGLNLSPDIWSRVFTIGGWATGGPEDDGDPK